MINNGLREGKEKGGVKGPPSSPRPPGFPPSQKMNKAMTDERLTAEQVASRLLRICSIRNSFVSNDPKNSRTIHNVLSEEIQKYSDQRVAEAQKVMLKELLKLVHLKWNRYYYLDLKRRIGQCATSPIPKPANYGGHFYPNLESPKDPEPANCDYGCGCFVGFTKWGGPDGISPIGECPNNPGGWETKK